MQSDSIEPIILQSAHRHGVAEADMLHALRFPVGSVHQSDSMVMFIGPDQTGVLIEVGVVTWWVANWPSHTPCAPREPSI